MKVKPVYKFNPDNLQFYRVNVTFKSVLIATLSYFTMLLSIAFLFNILFSFFFETPAERRLRQENTLLLNEYKRMESRFDQASVILEDIQQRDYNIYRMIFNSRPATKMMTESGFSGLARLKDLDKVSDNVIAGQSAMKACLLREYLKNLNELAGELSQKVADNDKMAVCIPSIQPVENSKLDHTAAGYGVKYHPIYKIKKHHNGIDFSAPLGAEVFATGQATVEAIVRKPLSRQGNTIILNHGYGYRTVYAHLRDFNVRLNQKVKRGQVIGFVGNTGLSTAPHLHYEVLKDSINVDPAYYFFNELTPVRFGTLQSIALRTGQSFD